MVCRSSCAAIRIPDDGRIRRAADGRSPSRRRCSRCEVRRASMSGGSRGDGRSDDSRRSVRMTRGGRLCCPGRLCYHARGGRCARRKSRIRGARRIAFAFGSVAAIGLALAAQAVVAREVGVERGALGCALAFEILSIARVVGVALRTRTALNTLRRAYALTFVAREARNVGR